MNKNFISQELIESKIFLIRNFKVMFDKDLAQLYEVETKVLNQAVKRNINRFPKDFMFKLTSKEYEFLRSQFVTLKGQGQHSKYLPNAFTEHGILMLSSVLNSERAIQVNIQIMRTFTKLRKMLISYKDLKKKIEEMEQKYDYKFKVIFDAINKLLIPSNDKQRKKIGFL